MKALSLKQPWAWLLFHGKDVENRHWSTNYRGTLLIHASGNYDDEAPAWLAANFPGIEIPADLQRRAIIGKVKVVEIVTSSSSKWFFGPYGFILEDPVEFENPIPYPGKLGIFDVPDELLKNAG